MGVEAARLALRSAGGAGRRRSCGSPPRTPPTSTRRTPPRSTPRCASTRDAPALDLGGAVRSGVGALRIALEGAGTTLVVSRDIRTGLPDQPRRGRRRRRRRRAARRRRGRPDRSSPSTSARGAATEEFLDRWRTPGDRRSKVWEERFGETKYVPLGEQAWNAALKPAALDADAGRPRGRHRAARPRGARRSRKRLGVDDGALADDLAATVGNTGTAQPGLLLASRARAGRARARSIALVVARRRRRRARVPRHRRDRRVPRRPRRSAAQIDAGGRPPVRQVPVVAGHGHRRAAAPARAGPGVGVGGRPLRGLEVRLRRLARPRDRRAAPPAGTRVGGGRRARRHGAGTDGRRRGHDRHVHDRQAGVLAEPADRVRRRRLRRRRPLPGGAHRRRRGRREDRRPGRDDVPPAVHRRRHPRLLLEGPARSGTD